MDATTTASSVTVCWLFFGLLTARWGQRNPLNSCQPPNNPPKSPNHPSHSLEQPPQPFCPIGVETWVSFWCFTKGCDFCIFSYLLNLFANTHTHPHTHTYIQVLCGMMCWIEGIGLLVGGQWFGDSRKSKQDQWTWAA